MIQTVNPAAAGAGDASREILARAVVTSSLREQIGALQERAGAQARQRPVRWDQPSPGALHEWFGEEEQAGSRGFRGFRGLRGLQGWLPPLAVVAHGAGQALRAAQAGSARNLGVIWIGARCQPFGALLQDEVLRRASIFAEPADEASRLWAADVAIRCPDAAAVVIDGTGFDMAATRRLQLAAASTGCAALLLRPPWEMKKLSAARTRWRVMPEVSSTGKPRWTVHLLRCKGMQPAMGSLAAAAAQWTVEWDGAKGIVLVPANVLDGPSCQAMSQGTR